MKTFIKFLKGAAIGISVLLFILIGVLIYRNAASYKDVIHEDADVIFKIRIDAIGQSMVWDALKNPSYYYQKQKERDTIDDIDRKEYGFGLPANIFLYTIKGKSASTVFISFKISNVDDFKTFLNLEFGMEDAYSIQSIKVSKNKDGKIMAAYTKEQCVLVYNPNRDAVDAIFQDILSGNRLLSESSALFSKLKHATSHVNYVTLKDLIGINFVQGQALIQGEMVMSDYFSAPDQTVCPKFSEDSSLKMYINGMSKKTYKTVNFNEYEFELDSLMRYYKGNFSIEIAGSTKQTDTVITYEYNDDFEKVATKTLSEIQVPEITFQIAADAQKMLNYLEKTSIVEHRKVSKGFFPLYQIKIESTKFGLQGSTNLNRAINTNEVSNLNVFGLDIDFGKLKSQNQFPIMNSYFESLLNLMLTGSKINKDSIKIEGQFNLKDKDILAITQFL